MSNETIKKIAKPLSRFEQTKFLLRRRIHLRKPRKNKITRDQNLVYTAYNEGPWKDVLQSRYWVKAKNLNEFSRLGIPVIKGLLDDSPIISTLNGKLFWVKPSDMNEFVIQQYFEILKEHISKDDEILEVGCGIGIRLFLLRNKGLENKLIGTELTESGVDAAKQISDFFNCDIEFKTLDLTSDYDYKLLENKTIYSSHCLEQLKYHTKEVIDKILMGNPKQVIHFEPIFELFDEKNSMDKLSKKTIQSNDYQDNLLTTLQEYESQNRIKITDVKRLNFGINPFNETSLIRWIPNYSD